MEILNEITKEVFEREIPAAKMPERNTSVYERMKGMILQAYDTAVIRIVSPECEGLLESCDSLKKLFIRRVCLDAFIRTCRSLDLVLTATGFGIVSTDSTAPASRARVDALVEELTVEKISATGRMVTMLTSMPGWGETEQAKNVINTLFYSPDHLMMFTSLPLTLQNWIMATGRAAQADTLLRKEISEEYMDELLQKTRTATLANADHIIVQKCRLFIADYISQNNQPCPNKVLLQQIMEQMESYPDFYPTYKSSRIYQKRHGEKYRNQKEDPTFFFM